MLVELSYAEGAPEALPALPIVVEVGTADAFETAIQMSAALKSGSTTNQGLNQFRKSEP